jgi:hypothetical protein
LKFDTHIPTAALILAPNNNSFVNGNFSVEAVANDNVALKNVIFDVRSQDGSTWESGCVSTANLVYSNDIKSAVIKCTIGISQLIDGTTYMLRVHSGDYAGYGNVNPEAVRYFTIDRTLPTLPVLLKTTNNGYETTNNFNFSWTAATDISPVTYEFQSSGNSAVDGNGSLLNAWNSIKNGNAEQKNLTTPQIRSTGAPDGTYYWQVRSIDSAGNKSGWTSPWKMTIDTGAPSTPSIITPTMDQYFKSTPIKATWSPSADKNGISQYQVEYIYDDGHTFAGTLCDGRKACREVSGTQTYRDHNPGLNEQGGVTIRVRSFDKAGNVSQWSEPIHYTYDATVPIAKLGTILSPVGGATKNIKITGNVDDINIASYQLIITNETGEIIKDTTKLVRGSITDLDDWDISSLISGKYTLTLIATDIVGHISTDTKEVIVDNTAPIIVYADSNIKDNEITPKITLDDYKDFNWAADPLNPTGVVFDDSLIAPIFTVINDGVYRFTLTVKDELGNISNREFSFNYTAPIAAAQASTALTAAAPVLSRVISPQFTNVSVGENAQGEVLGAQTNQPEVSVVDDDDSNTAEVKGLTDAKEANSESQSIFGFAWYWWIVGIASASIAGWAGVKFLGRNDNRENI